MYNLIALKSDKYTGVYSMKNHAIIYKKAYHLETVHAKNLHSIRRLLKTICAMHRMEIYMKKKFSEQEKIKIIDRHFSGERISSLSKEHNISRTTLYSWKSNYAKKKHLVSVRNYKQLKERLVKTENMIKILQTTSSLVNSPSIKKYDTVTELSTEFNISTICEALNLAKGSYYNHILRAKKGDSLANKRREELKPIIEDIYNENKQIFGAKKITAILKDKGYSVSESFVGDIMHKNDMFSIRGSAKTLYLRNKLRKENILKQNFSMQKPNQVWVSDVTYFKFNNKTYYICAIIDLYARKVVACKTSRKNSTQLVKSTFKTAYDSRAAGDTLLFHTDRGSNYTSNTFVKYLNELNVTQSFSRKSMPYDNSVCETFFSNLKREELYRTNYRSEKKFYKGVANYISFYNSKRSHSTNMNLTPDKKEAIFFDNHKVLQDKCSVT